MEGNCIPIRKGCSQSIRISLIRTKTCIVGQPSRLVIIFLFVHMESNCITIRKDCSQSMRISLIRTKTCMCGSAFTFGDKMFVRTHILTDT